MASCCFFFLNNIKVIKIQILLHSMMPLFQKDGIVIACMTTSIIFLIIVNTYYNNDNLSNYWPSIGIFSEKFFKFIVSCYIKF
jgi:hypothetical protein